MSRKQYRPPTQPETTMTTTHHEATYSAHDPAVQEVNHYLMLRQANGNQYDDNAFAFGLASCRSFLEKGVAFNAASLHYASIGAVTIGDVRPDMPMCVLGCMLENKWRPDRATALSELFREYHAAGHFDANAMVQPPTKNAAAWAQIPAVDGAALTRRFDQMFLLLELGAFVARDDYDLLSSLDILNLPDRTEIGIRINHIVMARQITAATSTGPNPAPESEERPTVRRRVRV